MSSPLYHSIKTCLFFTSEFGRAYLYSSLYQYFIGYTATYINDYEVTERSSRAQLCCGHAVSSTVCYSMNTIFSAKVIT